MVRLKQQMMSCWSGEHHVWLDACLYAWLYRFICHRTRLSTLVYNSPHTFKCWDGGKLAAFMPWSGQYIKSWVFWHKSCIFDVVAASTRHHLLLEPILLWFSSLLFMHRYCISWASEHRYWLVSYVSMISLAFIPFVASCRCLDVCNCNYIFILLFFLIFL